MLSEKNGDPGETGEFDRACCEARLRTSRLRLVERT